MERIAGLLLFLLLSGCMISDPDGPGSAVSYPTPPASGSYAAAPDESVGPYGASPAYAVPARPMPTSVTVSIVGALIGPGKADGRTWDGPGHIDANAMGSVVGALAKANAYMAAAAVVGALSMDAFSKPDPYGYADLLAPNQIARVALPLTYKDTFTPSWPGAELRNVPLRDGVRIRITLIDKDLSNDDPMGTVELNRNDLMAALEAGAVYPVRVAEQSANQVLFINVSVLAE